MADELTPAEVVQAYLAALNAHDPDAVCTWVSQDFHNEHTSARGHSVRGRAEYRQRLDGFLDTFRDLRYDVERMVVSGHDVAVAYRFTGRYAADPSRPRPFAIPGVFWFEVRDGQIVHRVDYYDGLSFEQQVTERTGGAG